MDYFFYKHFYDDLKNFTNSELLNHYNKFGEKEEEKRLKNVEELDFRLIEIEFDADFYKKFKKIKIPNNK